MTLMRLQRVLARAGVSSRRKAEDLIRAGRVRVDGAVASIGMSVDPERQSVSVDGRHIKPAAASSWFALNKPIGVVVSRGDPDQRRTVFDLVPDVPGLIYVGRLDVMTSGLLLFTTDGTAAHRLMHPRYAVHRTYRLAVHGGSADAVRRALGARPAVDRRPVAIVSALVRAKGKSVEVELTLAEGRHRIVRRLCEVLNLKIEWLHRVAYGPIRLADLGEGRSRPLTRREIDAIERLTAPAVRVAERAER